MQAFRFKSALSFGLCVLFCSWASGQNTLTAIWKDGKAESTKAYDACTKLTTVTDKVTNNSDKEGSDFACTTEFVIYGGGTIAPGNNEKQTWNTALGVVASAKGSITIQRYDDKGMKTSNSIYTAQRWISDIGGCIAETTAAKFDQVYPLLFGEHFVNDKSLIRFESGVFELGDGSYLMVYVLINNSDSNALFIGEDGSVTGVNAGEREVFFADADKNTQFKETPHVYIVLFDLGEGRIR